MRLVSLHPTPEELRLAIPSDDTLATAQAALEDHGILALKDVFDTERLKNLAQTYFERFGGSSVEDLEAMGSRVGHERYMLSLPFEPPFDDPHIYANPIVLPILQTVLGEDIIINSYSAVTAYPGASAQHVHQDHPLLFEDEALAHQLPAYAVTLVVPLRDLTAMTGGTQVWPESHRSPPSLWTRIFSGERVRVPAGSCYLMDYRLTHGGEPNVGQVARPVLYIAYSRPWFRDWINFKNHPNIRIDKESIERIPEAHRDLFLLARAPHLY